ncbi:hypothetical protein FKD80_19310 [Salmonella enterica]|nr:hypothetical protein [Salmonella enterica]
MMIMEPAVKFKIQHLQAAVALVLASFQPQPKSVACQPSIVERVYEMGSTVNKSDVSELTVALNDVAKELRSSRIELTRYADSDFSGAIKVANEIRNHTIHVAGIAESFVLMLPEKNIIQSYERNSVEFGFFRAIKMVSIEIKNYLSLIDQITRTTEVRDSSINLSAMNHLLDSGNRAAAKWR